MWRKCDRTVQALVVLIYSICFDHHTELCREGYFGNVIGYILEVIRSSVTISIY